jgi:hypothetical protein
LWFTHNQRTVVLNLLQDFMASTHTDFFQGQLGRGLIHLSNHSRKNLLHIQEHEEDVIEKCFYFSVAAPGANPLKLFTAVLYGFS